ncbi:MAG: DUF1501 domain-containing protein [Planctomycetaceae bacterium]
MTEATSSTEIRRRQFAGTALSGLSVLASAALTELSGTANAASLAADSLPQLLPRAKHVIYLHMIGAPSQLDLFDEKPELRRRHNQPCPESVTRGRNFAFIGKTSALAGSPWRFQRHGASGQVFSELLPELARQADELAVIRSLHTDEINHAPAQMMLHSGFGRGGRPALGAWVTFGLSAETRSLPAYVVLLSGPPGGAGTSLWSAGFLPGVYQGIPFRSQGDPVLFLTSPEGYRPEDRRRELNATATLNGLQQEVSGDPEAATRTAQYELAYRMQAAVPELMSIAGETQSTLKMYGAVPGKASFANNCLLARRLVERGVRMVELYDADWDHHSGLQSALPKKCRDVDRGMAALLSDLRQRGMLDETLVVWGSEFGRTPLRQGTAAAGDAVPGRDHHRDAFTVWMAGGGIRGGVSWGSTDEFGMDVVDQPVHVHDFNATILHQLGLDHRRLTWRFQGRDFRLTDVHGEVVEGILG